MNVLCNEVKIELGQSNNFTSLVTEAIIYGFLGCIFATIFIEFEEYYWNQRILESGLIIHSVKHSVGILPLFLGLSLSAIIANLLFVKIQSSLFVKWLFILVLSSVMVVLIQCLFLTLFFNHSFDSLLTLSFFEVNQNQLGLWWVIKLFIILIPFTVLFASRKFLLEKIKANRTYSCLI